MNSLPIRTHLNPRTNSFPVTLRYKRWSSALLFSRRRVYAVLPLLFLLPLGAQAANVVDSEVALTLLSQTVLTDTSPMVRKGDLTVVVRDDLGVRFRLRNNGSRNIYYLSSIYEKDPTGFVLYRKIGERDWKATTPAYGREESLTGGGYEWQLLAPGQSVEFEFTDLSTREGEHAVSVLVNAQPTQSGRREVISDIYRPLMPNQKPQTSVAESGPTRRLASQVRRSPSTKASFIKRTSLRFLRFGRSLVTALAPGEGRNSSARSKSITDQNSRVVPARATEALTEVGNESRPAVQPLGGSLKQSGSPMPLDFVRVKFEVDGQEKHQSFKIILYLNNQIIEPMLVDGGFLVPPELKAKDYVNVRFQSGRHDIFFGVIYQAKFRTDWTVGVDTKPFDSDNASEQEARNTQVIYYLNFEPKDGDGTRLVVLVHEPAASDSTIPGANVPANAGGSLVTASAPRKGNDSSTSPSDDAAVVINAVKPSYPPLAVAKNISGTVPVDVQIDLRGVVRKASSVGGPSLLQEAAQEAATRWRFNHVEIGSGIRSARLTFTFRPISYVPQAGESDFTAPYQIAVSWEGIAGSLGNLPNAGAITVNSAKEASDRSAVPLIGTRNQKKRGVPSTFAYPPSQETVLVDAGLESKSLSGLVTVPNAAPAKDVLVERLDQGWRKRQEAVLTDSEGRFELEPTRSGISYLRLSKPGFNTLLLKIQVKPLAQSDLNIELPISN